MRGVGRVRGCVGGLLARGALLGLCGSEVRPPFGAGARWRSSGCSFEGKSATILVAEMVRTYTLVSRTNDFRRRSFEDMVGRGAQS